MEFLNVEFKKLDKGIGRQTLIHTYTYTQTHTNTLHIACPTTGKINLW